jgi:hypothetical protein
LHKTTRYLLGSGEAGFWMLDAGFSMLDPNPESSFKYPVARLP